MSVQFISKHGDIELYRLSDGNSYAEIITYGARIHKLCVPDKNDVLQDVVLGYNTPEEYVGDGGYFNACVGRVANRIGNAEFTIDGITYKLNANEKGNQLHGGFEGFDKKNFDAQIDGEILRLTYLSKDGEEGYPGNVWITIEYSFHNNSLKIRYIAKSDRKTHCNLSNHAYFNLNGDCKDITKHHLTIKASELTDVNEELIPTGNIVNVDGTCYDFRTPHTIGERIDTDDRLMNIGGGYDFNYVLDKTNGPVATVEADVSGIVMNVYTDMPCVQFYSGNFLNGGMGKTIYNKHCSFALETQGYPNACNIESFPSTIIDGEGYSSETVYEFTVK